MDRALPFRLTLASGSWARQALLLRAGYEFDVRPADVDEPTDARFGSCRQYVQEVAWLKAAAVAPAVPDGVVLAADTVAWHNGRVIGKPADVDDARRIISSLAGQVHELWTGVCLWRRPDDWQLAWQERSLLRMRALSVAELDDYIAGGRWQGASGGYCIDEENDPYLTVIDGTVSNVIGLPMETLERVFDWIGR